MAIDLIAYCSTLTDTACGQFVKTSCTASPSECGVYVDFFDQSTVNQLITFAVPALLLAVAFRVGKKIFYPGI